MVLSNIKLCKTNLSGLPDNVTVNKVFKNDVQNFIGKLVSVLGSNNGFNVLDSNDINVYKKGTTYDLQNEDIVDNPNLEITIQAKDTSDLIEGTKDISVNLTVISKTNLSGLPDKVNISDVAKKDINNFIEKLAWVLHEASGFNNLKGVDLDVYKKGTINYLQSKDIVDNPNLEITIQAKDTSDLIEGTKDISVNLTVISKTNLSNLPDNVSSYDFENDVKENNVENFIDILLSFLSKNSGFTNLSSDEVNVYKKGTTDYLQNEDIVDNPNLEITIQAKDTSDLIEGTKDISVKLTVISKTNLSGLPDNVTVNNVKKNDVDRFLEELVVVLSQKTGFRELYVDDVNVYKKGTTDDLQNEDIVDNPNLEITIQAKDTSDFKGTKDISVKLTVR